MDDYKYIENDLEDIKIVIKHSEYLNKAKLKIKEALDMLSDIEDFTDERYSNLDDIYENIINLIIDRENYLTTQEV